MALSLEARLNALNFPTQLDEVKKTLDTAQPSVTFWGTRVVEVAGNDGSVSLELITKKVARAAYERCKKDDLTPAERIAGTEIVNKLQNLYDLTDTQIKTSNFITRFLVWIREFSFIPFTTRFYLDTEIDREFRAYSKEKFIQEFGDTFDDMDNHQASDGCFGSPLRICAREELIRAKLART